MSDPTFSVVIPAYNATPTIGSAIGSVLAQTRGDFELIVADDGSTDGTPDAVESIGAEDGRVRLIRQQNQGASVARNAGIGLARGEFVSFLDSDDLWMPGYLAGVSAALEADQGAGFAYTDAWVLHDGTKRICRQTELERRPAPPPDASLEEVMAKLTENNFVMMSSATIRRRIIEEVGTFDTSLRSAEDYDLWLRIVAAGYRPVQAPGRLLIQRDRFGSQSKDELAMVRGLQEALRRVAEEYEVPAATRDMAKERIRLFDRYARPATLRDRLLTAAYFLRIRLVRFVNKIWPDRYLHSKPPPEIAAAFPDLTKV
jgi:glycosyltransferase involved in cell wall biosynthesis